MGDTSMVEAAWGEQWEERGDTWYRFQVLLPSGNNPAYPGRFTNEGQISSGSGWDMFAEWHAPYGDGASCASMNGDFVGTNGSNQLLLRVGGGYECSPTYVYSHDSTPLQYDHWYDIVVHFTYSADPNVGFYEWYVDGRLIGSGHTPTIWQYRNGALAGWRYQVGLYRGHVDWTDTVYIDGAVAGPTRTSVGG